MANLLLWKFLLQQRPHTLPLALMQAAQTFVWNGLRTAIHTASGQVMWSVMRGGEIAKRDENHIRDLAAGGKRRNTVHAGEKSEGNFVIKAAVLAPCILVAIAACREDILRS